VFVIVMENKAYDEALRGSYAADLARRFGLATNYHAVAHPSLPNYLAMTSGSTWGIGNDGYHHLPQSGLGDQLTASRVSWRAYMEGMTEGCFNSPYPYAVQHNPFAYYGGACSSNVMPLTQLAPDLQSTRPRLAWIIPDLCHDTHDCSIASGDRWLSTVVPTILATSAWRRNGLLLITWDEDDGSASNHVATLVIAPDQTAHTSGVPYDHYSLLATVEDKLGVSRLRAAASATAMTDLMR
jgi:phospholipase C